MEVADIVEDDEEAFLKKGCSQVFQLHQHVNQYDISASNDEGSDSGKFSVMQGSIENEEHRSSCVSAEPMNKNLSGDLATVSQSPSFYSLDHQDWEDGIFWDNSPSSPIKTIYFILS